MSDQQSFHLLERVSSLLRMELRRLGTEFGLPLVQLEALHYFSICNRYSDTLGGLVAYLGLTKGTMSQTVRALESKGLLEKIASEGDRRVVHCNVTKAGNDILAQTYPPPLFASAWAEFAEEPVDEFVVQMRGFLRALQEQHGQRSFGLCRTCRHFKQQKPGSFLCGLTEEPLSVDDSQRICREHESQDQ